MLTRKPLLRLRTIWRFDDNYVAWIHWVCDDGMHFGVGRTIAESISAYQRVISRVRRDVIRWTPGWFKL